MSCKRRKIRARERGPDMAAFFQATRGGDMGELRSWVAAAGGRN
jgi:hypothetical protein